MLDGVSAHYGRISALHQVSLNVHAGEFVAVVGPNGAGKTTMLHAIAGVLEPSAGTITFQGNSLVGRSPEKIVREGVALVPEGRHIFGTMSVEDNLLLGATPWIRRSEVDEDIERVLCLFPVLRKRFRSTAGKLSGGEQQQLAIGRALLSRPKLLLLDEPSLGLAPFVVDAVFDTLAELCSNGITILLVEQNAAMAAEAADRTYVLRTGRIELAGAREELVNMENFERVFLGFTGVQA